MGTPNWSNQTMWTGDNLPIMRGMNTASVDLIYLDPPFNSKHDYSAPIGSKAAGAAFKDTWDLSDVDLAWLLDFEKNHPDIVKIINATLVDSDKAYLIYMAPRLLEMRRILKSTGSIYLHCDPTMSHYLKLLMDAVFGRKNFRNEIVWCYTGPGNAKRWFPRKHDVILSYSKEDAWTFNVDSVRIPYNKLSYQHKHESNTGIGGKLTPDNMSRYLDAGKIPEDYWLEDRDKMSPVGRLLRERIGYPTQKPLALLDRIIKASSNEGDMILDPFCGCATACVSAHNHNRQWAGIDISSKAYTLVQERIETGGGMFYSLNQRFDIPARTDLGRLPRYNCKENKQKLYGEQDGNCNGCREHFKSVNLTVDHIIARKVGGTDHISNLQLLCGHCNSVKGSFGMEYLLWKLGSGSSHPYYKPGFPHYPSSGYVVEEEQRQVVESH